MKFDTERACSLYAKHYEFRLENFGSVNPIRQDEYVLSAYPFFSI